MEEQSAINLEKELSDIVQGAQQLVAMNHHAKFETLSESLNLLCTDIRKILDKNISTKS